MLTTVQGTLIDELRARNGGDRVLRVDSQEIAPEFMPGDYIGFANPHERAPKTGDCVLARQHDGRLTLRIYEDLAGDPALMPVLMASDEDLIFGASAIEGVALWLQRFGVQAPARPLRIHAGVAAG